MHWRCALWKCRPKAGFLASAEGNNWGQVKKLKKLAGAQLDLRKYNYVLSIFLNFFCSSSNR